MKVFRVFLFSYLTHVLPGNLWFWHLHAGASGGPSWSFSCSFFHRTAQRVTQRQECAFNGKAKVLWEELRLDPQDSGMDVRCGHLCRFLIWWSIFFLNFISFFRGWWPFLVRKNGDRFHKETVYLTVSQWWIQTFLEFSHLFEGRWTHFDFCIFSAMSWLRWRTSSCDISRCGWPSSEVSLRAKSGGSPCFTFARMNTWAMILKWNLSTDYSDMYNFD